MGIFAKLTPSKASTKASAPIANKPGAPAASTGAAPTGGDADDVATYFTTFMVIYYGFFGLTLLLYPYVHAQDGLPFTNPMAYWTTISDELAFAFRICGAAFLTLILGPFTDELFGTVGVKMKAFTIQMVFVNLFIFFIFVYYTFYDPLATAVPLVWKVQTGLGGAILAWNLIEAVSDETIKTNYLAFVMAYYSFFGVALSISPSFFFGPPSPVAYWNTWNELGYLTARSTGLSILGLITMGYFLMPTNAYCKQLTFINVANMVLFLLPAFYGGASAVTSMWQIQFFMQIPITIVGLYIELAALSGPWAISFSFGPCGPTLGTYGLVNLVWMVPFIIGFIYDPNMLFGPDTITGFPMFTAAMGETELWFGRTWAVLTAGVVFGPYLFGCPIAKTVKQFIFLYLAFCGLFVYAILSYSVFVPVMSITLASLNGVLGLVGLYLIQAPGGEPMF